MNRRSYLRVFLFLFAAWMLAAGCRDRTSTEQKKPASNPPRPQDPLRAAILDYQTRLQQISRARIVGGLPAEPGEFPWQVALIKAGFTPKDGQFCGGSIIALRWILTAAHCFPPGAKGSDQDVFVGSIYLDDGGETLKIDRIYKHERFDFFTFDNDIALLFLSSEVKSGQPIQLLQRSEAPPVLAPRRNGRVSGWGQIVERGPKSARLRYVDVPFQSQSICAKHYRDANSIVTSNMICAGYDNPNQGDACGGDSGGPLVVPVGKEFKLAGAVSWGDGCSRAGMYGLYTRLTNYLEWIDAHMAPTDTEARSASPRAETPVSAVRSMARQAWMAQVDWSITNADAGGSTDCPTQYPYPGCILSGGRACLMTKAIASAKVKDCANAFRVTKITQCHNRKAEQLISDAGENAVCTYLKSK